MQDHGWHMGPWVVPQSEGLGRQSHPSQQVWTAGCQLLSCFTYTFRNISNDHCILFFECTDFICVKNGTPRKVPQARRNTAKPWCGTLYRSRLLYFIIFENRWVKFLWYFFLTLLHHSAVCGTILYAWNRKSITLANTKTHPILMLTNFGPEWCAEHDGVFRFSNFVLVFP